MRALLMTLGTRGDVQPFVVLARGLIDAGHQVQVAASRSFDRLAADHQVPFRPLDLDFTELQQSADAGAIMRGDVRAVVNAVRSVKPMFRASLVDQAKAVDEFEPDVLLTHPKTLGGPHLAEWRGIKHANALVVPGFTRTGAFPPLPLTWTRSPAWLNRAAYNVIPLGLMSFKGVVAEWRRSLGLDGPGRLWNGGHPTLYGYSPAVVPNPDDWENGTEAVGYWLPDPRAEDSLDRELDAFITAGEQPVYIGFGSSVDDDPARLGALVADAVARCQRRAVVQGRREVIELESNERIHVIDGAPHSRLFPRMACVVHHGGSGTTAEAIRSGRPQVVVPFSVDQPFWARRMHSLGVATEPLPRRKLTAERLAAAITDTITRSDRREAATSLAERIRHEDGIGRGVAYLERL